MLSISVNGENSELLTKNLPFPLYTSQLTPTAPLIVTSPD